jgi:hypothetical protein
VLLPRAFQSASELSLVSGDALDVLLSNESFMVNSKNRLLQILFSRRYPLFLR